MALAHGFHDQLFDITGHEEHAEAMIGIARESVVADPVGLRAWRDLGDLFWRLGDRRGAIEAYRRTLKIDDDYALKPSARLDRAERAVIERRLEGDAPGR